MSANNLVEWEGVGSYEHLELMMEQARKLRSQTIGGMIGTFFSPIREGRSAS